MDMLAIKRGDIEAPRISTSPLVGMQLPKIFPKCKLVLSVSNVILRIKSNY
jgi:hypothetical protein